MINYDLPESTGSGDESLFRSRKQGGNRIRENCLCARARACRAVNILPFFLIGFFAFRRLMEIGEYPCPLWNKIVQLSAIREIYLFVDMELLTAPDSR